MEHFSHDHPLILSKYYNSPTHALCDGCNDPILINTYVYHCIHQSTATHDSPCASFHLHKTCADLPRIIQHHLHIQHLLTLQTHGWYTICKFCSQGTSRLRFFYQCSICDFEVCCKCVSLERELNHPSHSHTLTLLPLKSLLPICTACGMEGSKEFSYMCKTCFFWIHESCASAPVGIVREDHHNGHALVLAYSLPKEYHRFGVSCYLCPKKVYPFYWLYLCAECRYFAHIQCVLSAAEFALYGKENDTVRDVERSNLVHLPASENQPNLLYKLIRQFTKFSILSDKKSGKADRISQCYNGHSLILFDNFNDDDVVETNTGDKRICDGCVQPLLSPSYPFYGCPDCNFFLHYICAAELPMEIPHASHPDKAVTRLTRCYQTSQPFNFHICKFCDRYCNGIVYCDESCLHSIDILCAALPRMIKHDSHRHSLELSNTPSQNCRGCGRQCGENRYNSFWWYLRCNICDYSIDIKCALKPGTIKHIWDEHQLFLMYPPVKGHPHAFNCELCSEDINPNHWFYHCAKCDTSFHTFCTDEDDDLNIKYGVMLEYKQVHEHNLELTRTTRRKFICNVCDTVEPSTCHDPHLKCVSCKFLVCMYCVAKAM